MMEIAPLNGFPPHLLQAEFEGWRWQAGGMLTRSGTWHLLGGKHSAGLERHNVEDFSWELGEWDEGRLEHPHSLVLPSVLAFCASRGWWQSSYSTPREYPLPQSTPLLTIQKPNRWVVPAVLQQQSNCALLKESLAGWSAGMYLFCKTF